MIQLNNPANYDTPTTKSSNSYTKSSPMRAINKIVQGSQNLDAQKVRKSSPSPISYDHGRYKTNIEETSKYSAQSLWNKVSKVIYHLIP